MLYEIIQLPQRDVWGDVDTIVPVFEGGECLDDVDWYGRSFDISMFNTMFKYKFIELIGKETIERICMTTEPIDLKKSWWTANEDVFPIYCKLFSWPFKSKTKLYRYYRGTIDVLSCLDQSWNQQTLHSKMIRICPRSFKQTPTQQKELLKLIVPSNDIKNIELYSDCIHRSDYETKQVNLPHISIDPVSSVYLDSPKLKQIGLFKSNEFGYIVNQPDLQDEPMFKFDSSVSCSDGCGTSKWTLHKLLHLFEVSAFTDISITMNFVSESNTTYSADFKSHYLGYCNREVYETEDFINARTEILECLKRWTISNSIPQKPTKVIVNKTWNEEVYIELYIGNHQYKYYFDLVAYSVATLSFVDNPW